MRLSLATASLRDAPQVAHRFETANSLRDTSKSGLSQLPPNSLSVARLESYTVRPPQDADVPPKGSRLSSAADRVFLPPPTVSSVGPCL